MKVEEIRAMVLKLRNDKEQAIANVNFINGAIEAFEAVLVELEKPVQVEQGAPFDEDLEKAKDVDAEVIGEAEVTGEAEDPA